MDREKRQKSERRGDKQSRDGWRCSRLRLSGRQQHSFISRPLLGWVRARNASFLPLFQSATLCFQASSFNTSPLLSHKRNQLPSLTDSTSAVPFTLVSLSLTTASSRSSYHLILTRARPSYLIFWAPVLSELSCTFSPSSWSTVLIMLLPNLEIHHVLTAARLWVSSS